MVDTWNPSDHTFSTLSVGNTIATGNNATVGLVRSVLGKSTGKIYFEGVGNWSNVNSSIGMCTSSISVAADLGGVTPTGGFTINRNGNVFYNNGVVLSISGWSNGITICYAVDFVSKLYWIRFGASGNWNNSGAANPATGVGGQSFSTTNTPLFVACTVANGDSSSFKSASGFEGTIPVGFSAWDSMSDGLSSGAISSQADSGGPAPNPYLGVVESATAVDTFTIQRADVDNIIDIEGFEKYGPALNSNIATYNSNTANIMNVHNNSTFMRTQGFFQEWIGIGGSTGSSLGFITGRAGGSSVALCISDGSGNTTNANKPLPGNYSRTIVGFAFVYNLGSACGIQFNEILSGNAMMAIWFDNLGKINISRGNMSGGTILYTSSALFTANVWHYVEIDFTIHPSAGTWTIWLDGVLINTTTGQNTRGFGSNNYWNLLIPLSRSATCAFDDIYIRDNTNGTALPLGDCTVDRLPVVANSSVQFTPGATVLGSRYAIQCVQTNAPGANQLALIPVTPAVNMTVNSIGILPGATNTIAKFKGVIYSDSSGAPGSLLSTGTEVIGVLTNETLNLPLLTPQALTGNTQYWIGYITDTSVVLDQSDNFSFVGQRKANTYTSGAPAGPLSGMTTGQPTWTIWGNCTNGSNFDVVDRIPSPIMQMAPIAYNSSSTVGQKDFFQAGSMPIVPNLVYALKVSALAQRSDTGARNMNIRIKSGVTEGTGSISNITPGGGMQWYYSIFETDPNTGAVWGPGAINLVKIGYEVAT